MSAARRRMAARSWYDDSAQARCAFVAISAARRTSSGVDSRMVSRCWPVAGSRTSRSFPVPVCHLARNGSSQPFSALSVFVSGAVATIAASFGPRGRFRESFGVGSWLVLGGRARAGCRVTPHWAAREDRVDQALLEVLRDEPGLDVDCHLTGVADQFAHALVGVVAGDDDELKRGQVRRLVGKRIQPTLHIVAQIQAKCRA